MAGRGARLLSAGDAPRGRSPGPCPGGARLAARGAAGVVLAVPKALLRALWRLRLPSDLWRKPMALARALWSLQIPRDLARVPVSWTRSGSRALLEALQQRTIPALYEMEEQASTLLAAMEGPFEPEPESPPVAVTAEAAPLPRVGPDAEQDRFGFWWFMLLNEALAQVAVALRPDIVHSNDLDSLLAGWLTKREVGCRLVYDSHELWTEQHHPRTQEWLAFFRGLEGLLTPQGGCHRVGERLHRPRDCGALPRARGPHRLQCPVLQSSAGRGPHGSARVGWRAPHRAVPGTL